MRVKHLCVGQLDVVVCHMMANTDQSHVIECSNHGVMINAGESHNNLALHCPVFINAIWVMLL